MVDMDRFRQTFFEECDDCLAVLESQLMEFQAGRIADDGVEEAFRAIHSIKGGAGAFGFARIIAVTHQFEAVLDRIRNHELIPSPELIATLLGAYDILADLISGERSGLDSNEVQDAAIREELAQIAERDAGAGRYRTPGNVISQTAGDAEQESEATQSQCYQICFRPDATLMERGNEPLLLLRELQGLGRLRVEADVTALPSLDAIDPLTCYLGWTLRLETDRGRDEIDEIFEFVIGDCVLEISEIDPVTAGTGGAGTGTASLGESLPQAEVDRAASSSLQDEKRSAGGYSSVRVDLERVDRMVNMVGEIVIAQAAIMQQVDETLNDSHPQLVESLQQFLRHTQNLQDSVMAIRAQPVKSIFDRMPRLVRELSKKTGKTVRLEISGEATEIDKTVIEKLSDPLTHMIRNAIDHGIEPPADRSAAGKPGTGLLRLSAHQRGSRIVIELSDDGRGLDRDAIRRKAVERGLIAGDAELNDQETDNLIFRPGFTTVDIVSDLSGRGVGMDVVNENIRRLGGRVAIRSQEGEGSTVTLILPLTLAVMDGMVVRVGPTSFIIPLTAIVESMALNESVVADLPGCGEVLRFRNEYLKVYDLRKLFGFDVEAEYRFPLLMVIETDNGEAIGLRVDEIIGQQQVVVKKIDDGVSTSPCIAGGSIMGNGEVALILDASGLATLEAARWSARSRAKPENAAA